MQYNQAYGTRWISCTPDLTRRGAVYANSFLQMAARSTSNGRLIKQIRGTVLRPSAAYGSLLVASTSHHLELSIREFISFC